ncbi:MULTISPECIES: hypothetical protein [unclassified Microbacterium]|uniref:hypothetical protein n=1 Tax=Microbacterium TaxID=33882 RepID=UPI003BA0A2A5
MTGTNIYCPSCGHHLFKADVEQLVAATTPASAVARTPATDDAAVTLERFFESQSRVIRADRGRMTQADVIAAVNGWLEDQGEQPLTLHAIGRGMRALGIETSRSNGRRFYAGVMFTGAPA